MSKKTAVKKPQSAKAKAASMKNLAKHENAQNLRARLSDNGVVRMEGFVLGSSTVLLACFIGLFISKNL